MHMASASGFHRCIQILADSGIDVNNLSSSGATSLHLAAQAGHIECVRVLLSCGAQVDLKDKEGNTALDFANANGHANCVMLLWEHGAGMKTRLSGETVEWKRVWEVGAFPGRLYDYGMVSMNGRVVLYGGVGEEEGLPTYSESMAILNPGKV